MTLADIATTTKKISNEETVTGVFIIEFEHINARFLPHDVTLYFDVLEEDESLI